MDVFFKTSRGFHLVELLTTVAIVGMLAAFVLPLYSQYTIGTKRLEAASMLSRLAVAMEKFHVEHNTYEHATLAALNFF